jgi:IS5 family transposase
MQFADVMFAQICPSHRFLEEISRVIPWDLFEKALQNKIRHKTGRRPPYPRLLLFKMYLLQMWFGLSDAQTSFQCVDRLSFRKF